MAFYFGRGLCYRQDITAVTALGFVWNAWLSIRLFFFSLIFVRGASALRPDSWEEGLSSSTCVQSAKNSRFTAFYCFTPATGTTGTGSYRPFS